MFGNPSLPRVRPFGLRRIRLILNVSPIHFGFRLASRLQSGTLRLGNPGFRTCSNLPCASSGEGMHALLPCQGDTLTWEAGRQGSCLSNLWVARAPCVNEDARAFPNLCLSTPILFQHTKTG